jgi:sugar-specific transcriptional regulator TrmB
VETMKLRLEETIRASERVILADLQPLYERREVRERPDIWIVRGQYNILAKIKEIFTRTVRELQLAIPLLPEQAANLLEPALMGLRVRGVKVVILITEDTPKGLLQQLMGLGELRVKDKMFGGGVISDGREVMLLLSGEGEEESTLAIWSDHIGLAKFAKSYFAFLWDTARPPPP